MDPLLHSNTSTITPSVTSDCNTTSFTLSASCTSYKYLSASVCKDQHSVLVKMPPSRFDIFELQAKRVKLLDSFKLHMSAISFFDFTDQRSKIRPNTGGQQWRHPFSHRERRKSEALFVWKQMARQLGELTATLTCKDSRLDRQFLLGCGYEHPKREKKGACIRIQKLC